MIAILFSALATPILFVVFFDWCCRIDLENNQPIATGVNLVSAIIAVMLIWGTAIVINWAVGPHA